uniref:Neutral and basic amino acid transport protein rBAT-like n=1 Tax=Crassostrea virginica TaxID=6565 RepID=A0A8B8AMG9_CRAVI|nr:neutral and basic amino acid transport protein rBAT-like [Crassostrea virginica]
MYDSNDDDHMAIADHMRIKNVFGTMDDFDLLRNITKEKKVRLIVDFIPNHTGRGSAWFKKSRKKEGKYKDYYIWAPCDPKNNTYPNNWMSIKGGRGWTYDETRGECFLHQLEDDKPDLNLWNPDVQKELENILRFWMDKEVDDFHIRNVQYLYEDHKLGNESLIPGKTGQAYGDFEHNQTRNHPENAKILQAWKAVVDSYSTKDGEKKALIITADENLNATLRYMKAGVSLVRVNPLSGNGASLAERIETTLKDVHLVIKSIGWMFSDKYSSRLASREGSQQTKALLTLQATLPGVPFIYYGNEIGMTDHPEVPGLLKYRTPMQWNSNGTGFSMNRPWIDRNPNYKTINVERERASDNVNSLLKLNQKLQKLREMEPFPSGVMSVPFRDGDLLVYTREGKGFPEYLVAINFGGTSTPFSNAPGIYQKARMVFHTHKEVNTTINVSLNSYELGPNHAVVFEII